MIHEVGNIELCELLDVEPKAQCKNMSLTLWRRHRLLHVRALLAKPTPNYYIKKGRPTGTFTGRSQGITIATSRIRSRKNARRSFTWVSTTGSSEAKSSARTCSTSVAPKKYVVRWTNWRTKTTRTTSLQKKFVCTETIGWFVRTQLVPIRCQFGIDLISSQHCQPLRQLKNKEDAAHQQKWQSYSSSWWNWKESWWHSSSGHHHEDGPSSDWSGKPVEKWLGYLVEAWFLELIWCSTVQNSITANSSLLSPTGCVNTIPPNTEK